MSDITSTIPDPILMAEIIDGRRYGTQVSTRIAYHWRAGHALRYYSTARRIHVFMTRSGNYFCQEQETQPESSEIGPFGWTRLQPLSVTEAVQLYLVSDHKLLTQEEAFPGLNIDA